MEHSKTYCPQCGKLMAVLEDRAVCFWCQKEVPLVFHFPCLYCDRDIKATAEAIGVLGECPHCGQDIKIPDPTMSVEKNKVNENQPLKNHLRQDKGPSWISQCSSCGKEFKAYKHMHGRIGNCPYCNKEVTIIDPESKEEETPQESQKLPAEIFWFIMFAGAIGMLLSRSIGWRIFCLAIVWGAGFGLEMRASSSPKRGQTTSDGCLALIGSIILWIFSAAISVLVEVKYGYACSDFDAAVFKFIGGIIKFIFFIFEHFVFVLFL